MVRNTHAAAQRGAYQQLIVIPEQAVALRYLRGHHSRRELGGLVLDLLLAVRLLRRGARLCASERHDDGREVRHAARRANNSLSSWPSLTLSGPTGAASHPALMEGAGGAAKWKARRKASTEGVWRSRSLRSSRCSHYYTLSSVRPHLIPPYPSICATERAGRVSPLTISGCARSSGGAAARHSRTGPVVSCTSLSLAPGPLTRLLAV